VINSTSGNWKIFQVEAGIGDDRNLDGVKQSVAMPACA
jgi:hypothetical protein